MKKILGLLTSPRFLFFYIVLSLAVPNVALCFTEHMPVLACVANVVLPVSLYALLMTLSKKTGRQVWFLFLIVFFAAFQIVLLYLFGRGVIAVDMFLNLVTTNPGEAMELLNNLVPAVATVFILYLPLLVLAAMSWARHRTEDVAFLKRVRRYSWCGMAAGAVLIALCYAAYPKDSDFDYRAEDHVYPANIFYNLYLACRESGRVADYRKDVASFRFNARSAHDADSAEVYVLVIGETARADNFQLYGYERETNPLLSKTDGLSVFRHVLSQSNTTHKSVPMLLAAASAENHARLYREKSLITAFREAGFHTSFISNQQPNHSFIDFFGDEADDFVFIRSAVSVITGDVTAQTSDERLLPYVKNILAKKRKKELIVLHTYGSHFNYRDRYPQSHAKFLPDTPTEAEPRTARSSSTPTTTPSVRPTSCCTASSRCSARVGRRRQCSTRPTTARTSSTTIASASSTLRPRRRRTAYMCRSLSGPRLPTVRSILLLSQRSTPTARRMCSRARLSSRRCSPSQASVRRASPM